MKGVVFGIGMMVSVWVCRYLLLRWLCVVGFQLLRKMKITNSEHGIVVGVSIGALTEMWYVMVCMVPVYVRFLLLGTTLVIVGAGWFFHLLQTRHERSRILPVLHDWLQEQCRYEHVEEEIRKEPMDVDRERNAVFIGLCFHPVLSLLLCI